MRLLLDNIKHRWAEWIDERTLPELLKSVGLWRV